MPQRNQGLTVSDLASAKAIPEEVLRSFGVTDGFSGVGSNRRPSVDIPYSDVAGEIHALTGAAHFGLRRYQQAIEPLQRALSENLDSLPGTRPMPQPEFERMLLQLSSALYVVGDKDAAWQPLTLLTGTAGQTVAYDYGLLLQARILAENGRSAEACAHLRLAKEHDPPPQVTDALESQSRALSCR